MWLQLHIYDVTKPKRDQLTLIDTKAVTDFFEETMRDEKDDEIVHTFTVAVFGPNRAIRLRESTDAIFGLLALGHREGWPMVSFKHATAAVDAKP